MDVHVCVSVLNESVYVSKSIKMLQLRVMIGLLQNLTIMVGQGPMLVIAFLKSGLYRCAVEQG